MSERLQRAKANLVSFSSVKSKLGQPAQKIRTKPSELGQNQKVWAHDWFAQFPPTVEELATKDEAAN
jgi:hypothetical protein